MKFEYKAKIIMNGETEITDPMVKAQILTLLRKLERKKQKQKKVARKWVDPETLDHSSF